jgi:hypothetical protein
MSPASPSSAAPPECREMLNACSKETMDKLRNAIAGRFAEKGIKGEHAQEIIEYERLISCVIFLVRWCGCKANIC